MLKDIINRYGNFCDSWITELKIIKESKLDNIKSIEIVIFCANLLNDYKYERIKLIFSDIIDFSFIQSENNYSVDEIFILEKKDSILFDFDAIDYFDYFEENPNSKFKIQFKKIQILFIEEYKLIN